MLLRDPPISIAAAEQRRLKWVCKKVQRDKGASPSLTLNEEGKTVTGKNEAEKGTASPLPQAIHVLNVI
jgi:hypothetical protein